MMGTGWRGVDIAMAGSMTYRSPGTARGSADQEDDMTEHMDNLTRQLARGIPRRQALLGLGALALGTAGALGAGQAAEAKRCHRHNRKCKARCDRKHADGSFEQSNCRSNCGLACIF